MLINTETTFAVRCPSCGKMSFETVSRFSFKGDKPVRFNCSCGSPILVAGTKNRRRYWLQVPCVLCETNHLFYYQPRQFWSGEVNYAYCHDTNVELCFFGQEDKVKAIAENYEHNLDTLVDEMGYDDYFVNPEVMFEALNFLHDIAEEGYLFCGCGNNNIEVDILPDRIELLCRQCKTNVTVFAENEEDLAKVHRVKKLELARDGFKGLDTRADRKKSKKREK